MATNSFTYQLKTANIALKLIIVNVAVYLLFNLVPWVVGINASLFTQWFSLPSDLGTLLTQPWSVVTYAFLHGGVWHLLWNMVYLYFFSKFILNLFSEKRFLTIYLLGGIVGGLLFVASYNLLPAFSSSVGVLIGASAAVNAIIVFIAAYSPQTSVRLLFFDLKLWQIAVILVVLDLLNLPTSGNAGGLVSHLGGAAFGYLYAQQLEKGNDIGGWFESLLTTMEGWFSASPKRPRAKMRTVHKTKRSYSASKAASQRSASSALSKSEKQRKIDAILDKISNSGYDSLSKTEKDFLFKAGKD